MTSADVRAEHPHVADELTENPPSAGRLPRRPPRVERFIARYGWRAYALPALTALAIVALVIAILAPSSNGSAGAAHTSPASSDTAATDTTEPPSASEPPTSAAAQSAVPAEPTENYVMSGDNSLSMVPGQSAVLGTGGQVHKFDVEVEGGTGVDGAAFAAAVEQILADPRSWGAGGKLSFQRVSDGSADFHIDLVSPNHVEGFCPGYNTNGYTSCRNGDRVVINLARWSIGVTHFAGQLQVYREYVINHEVGHYLGRGHVNCTGSGRKAPVMMQQTLALGQCTMNAWPYPNGPADNPDAPA